MISNRFLVFMTALVLLGMGVLFVINFNSILGGKPIGQTYLEYNDVRGIAIKHKDSLYTLNFSQQNQLIDFINQSIKIQDYEKQSISKPDFQQIIIYLFNGKPDLILEPVGYMNENLIYTNKEWNPSGYMRDVSAGSLKRFLSETYDH